MTVILRKPRLHNSKTSHYAENCQTFWNAVDIIQCILSTAESSKCNEFDDRAKSSNVDDALFHLCL